MTETHDSGASGWQIKRGVIAVVICILCSEAVIAGGARQCMPSFSPDILAGQMLLFNMFGIPEIMSIVAGVPAFVMAATPEVTALRFRRLPAAFAALAIASIVVAVAGGGPQSGFSIIVGLVVAGALIGFAIRRIEVLRRFWLPFGVVLALMIAVAIFLAGHYGSDCVWP